MERIDWTLRTLLARSSFLKDAFPHWVFVGFYTVKVRTSCEITDHALSYGYRLMMAHK